MPTYLNDRPIDDLVAGVLQLDGHLAPELPVRASLAMANAPGVFGSQVTVGARTVTVALDVRPATVVDRTTALDALTRRLTGLLILRTDDAPDRELYCVCSKVDVQLYAGAYSLPTVFVVVTLVAVDPTRYELEPRVYGLSTARTGCPVGTVPSAPLLYLYGGSPSVVNPVVICRNYSGEETHRMTLTGTLATNDALMIDCARQVINRYVAGVIQTGTNSGNAWFTLGAFPLLAPEDAVDGAGLTVELTAASGTPTGAIVYARRW